MGGTGWQAKIPGETSHTIAPRSPQKRTQSCHFGSICFMSTRSFATVFATRVPKTANATKLKKAAQATACRGVRTRVATAAAIEFAASCQPFVRSKSSATVMIGIAKVRVFSTLMKVPRGILCGAKSPRGLLSHALMYFNERLIAASQKIWTAACRLAAGYQPLSTYNAFRNQGRSVRL
jgi:hypothetical protein